MSKTNPRTLHLLILLCVSVPSFMTNLDANIVAVSLPAIAASLKADFASMEWVISGYTLPFASLVMFAGGLADLYGRKRILIVGLSLFTLASFFCGAAHSVLVLNVARVFQGAGAALLLSSALAILSHEFRGAERARAFAFWGSVIGIAVTLGPIAGGLITQGLGWQWAFYVNVPVGIAIIALTVYAVDESRDESATSLDIGGSATLAGSLFFMTLGLISGNAAGWTAPRILAELAAALVLFGMFIAVELRSVRPMLDLRVFTLPTYIGAMAANVAYATSLLTMLTYIPLFLQSGLGLTPLHAGLAMLPMAVPMFVVPRLVARHLIHRLSGRALLTIGLILVASGMLWLGITALSLRYLEFLIGMLAAGTGAGILNGEIVKVAMTVIPPERAGMASGASSTVRFAGIVVGFAALGAILVARVLSALELLIPNADVSNLASMSRSIVAGETARVASSLGLAGRDTLRVFAQGYQSIFLTAAFLAALSAWLAWKLVRAADTPAHSLSAAQAAVAIPVE